MGNTHRPIYVIAKDIIGDWQNVNYGARPYLEAMLYLTRIDENYHYEDAESIVIYFLANAHSWRGDKAREIKKELQQMVKDKHNNKLRDIIYNVTNPYMQ